LGRVTFTKKAEPAVDWHEIECRLQDISASSPPSHVPSDLPLAPSASLANDPPAPDDPALIPAATTAASDPLHMLSLLTGNPSNRS
jgi:hypothetical protein